MRSPVRTLSLPAIFASLTCIGSLLHISFGAASVTLQFFFAATAGILLGPKLGAVSQLLYIILGLSGLPVFAHGGGLGYVFQPSFGFLLGLIPATYVIGALANQCPQPHRIFGACLVGIGVLYLIGMAYQCLIFCFYLDDILGCASALKFSFFVYLPLDFIKVLVVSRLCPILLRRLPSTSFLFQ